MSVINRGGSYGYKIKSGHSGCKGKVMCLEIYGEWNGMAFSSKGSKPIGYGKGACSFT